MTSPEGQGYRKRPTNIQHAEGPDSTGPWSLTKSVKFGEPSAEPEEHNEALPATSNTAQSPADLEQTNLSRDASPRRPGQCIWVLDDPIVRGKRFRLQCRAPKENNDLHLLFVRTEKKRLSVVALDVALAKEKGLEAAKLVYNKRLAKPFLCSRAVRLDFSYRKQDCSMAVTPSSNGEAQVALCLVKEATPWEVPCGLCWTSWWSRSVRPLRCRPRIQCKRARRRCWLRPVKNCVTTWGGWCIP